MADHDSDNSAKSSEDVYNQLLEKRKRITYLEGIETVLKWDERTVLPEGGTPARFNQRAVLFGILHQLRTDPEFGNLLAAVDDGLSPREQSNVREIRREYERNTAVPPKLAARLSATISKGSEAWQQAKAVDDFGPFEEHLNRIIRLKRKTAVSINPDAEPYAVLFTDYAPYTKLESVERIFDRIRRELVPLVEAIRKSDTELTTDAFEGTFDIDTQVAVCRDILDMLGFDGDRGHLDTMAHTSTIGDQYDCRIGLQPTEDDLFRTLYMAIHEFGHALYNQNLPQEQYGTPLGTHRGAYVHESQATLWDHHVGRTPAFWEYIRPTLTQLLPSIDADARRLYESFVQVRPDEPNVLRADELTWHLHMLVRFEVERALVAGDIDSGDVSEVWRDTYVEYLGFRPESERTGPLATIHWADGVIGYFPTYTLGPVLAAQFVAAAREAIDDFDEKIRRGEFGPLREWLHEEIHRHGQRYTTPELIRRVTGEDLTADHFLDYVTEKYTELYEL